MRMRLLIVPVALLAMCAASVPACADQLLPQGRILDSGPASGDILFGALKLGKRQAGKTTLTPDSLAIQGAGSTGPVGGMSVTPIGVPSGMSASLAELFSDAGRSALFGVKCDGATGTDNTASINAMLAALNDAVLPPGVCRVRNTLTIPPGHTFRGAGSTATVLYVSPDFDGSASGIVKLSGAGSRFIDIGMDFAQPDTGTRSALTTYPPAITAIGSGGSWTIDRVRVAHATKTLDARGEQGQSKIGLLETSFFAMGVDIDGATDSINVGTLRFWPYGFTPNQYQVLLDGNTTINGGQGMIGLNAGRMDGLIIDSFFSIFYPKAMRFYYSAGYGGDTARAGIATAAINKMQLDTTGGLVCEWCDLSISSAYINIGFPGYSALVMHGGSVNIGQLGYSQFTAQLGGVVTFPATEPAAFQVDNLQQEAKLTVSGMTAALGAFDRNLFSFKDVNGAFNQPIAQITGIAITKDPAMAYTKPVFDLTGATGNILGVQINNLTTGSGTLFNAPNDNPLTIVSSATVGWANTGPSTSSSRYTLNYGMKDGALFLPLGSGYVGANLTAAGSVIGATGLWTGNVGSPTRVIDGSQNVKAAMFGANGASPAGKCTLSAALPTDGTATSAALATAINALRSCGLTNGLAQ